MAARVLGHTAHHRLDSTQIERAIALGEASAHSRRLAQEALVLVDVIIEVDEVRNRPTRITDRPALMARCGSVKGRAGIH